MPIAKISLPNMPLADAVQLVSAMSTLPVSFDPDAMEELGVSLHDPISIEVANTTVGKTLEEIAAKRNMAPVVENGQIVLTSTAEHRESLRHDPLRRFRPDRRRRPGRGRFGRLGAKARRAGVVAGTTAGAGPWK